MWSIKQGATEVVAKATNSAKEGMKNLGLWGSRQ